MKRPKPRRAIIDSVARLASMRRGYIVLSMQYTTRASTRVLYYLMIALIAQAAIRMVLTPSRRSPA